MSERERPARTGAVRTEPGMDGAGRTAGSGAGTAEAGPVLARLARPRAADPTTIAVVSDPHVSTRRTGTWKCFHRTEHRLQSAVEGCNGRGADAVVVTGDLTADGHRADFDRVHELLADLNAPVYAVPGNHDVPKEFDDHETPPVSAFERRFAPGGFPFHVRVGDVDLVGIDTASTPDGSLSDTHAGRASHDQLGWLDDLLAQVTTPVVVGHHNLSPSLPGAPFVEKRRSFPLRDDTALLETLAVHDVPLYCSGHLHVPALAENAGVRELVVPPLSSFPQGHLRLEVGPGGTTVRYVPVAGPDGTAEAYLAARNASSVTEAASETALSTLSALPLRDETPPGR